MDEEIKEKEYRIFGPPGTGKTTYLSKQINRAVKSKGSSSVIVASFTKAAAEELVSRKLPLSKEQVGTLHSHCYRNLGFPELIYNHIEEWNKFAPEFKLSQGTQQTADLDDPKNNRGRQETEAEELLKEYKLLREKMTGKKAWPVRIRGFAKKWEQFKEDHNLVDFIDMIEKNYKNNMDPPGDPFIGFFDEAQDFTPLELSLIRQWSKNLNRILIVGDDDQNLYSFKGATPDAFLNPPLPEDHIILLNQSYRVPKAVQEKAHSWIKQIDNRQKKEYKPRDEEGELRYLNKGNYKNPEPILKDAKQYLKEDKKVMFLTTCGYMLEELIGLLREQGIIFHNPYSRKRGQWNPLTSRGTSSKERLLAYFVNSNEVFGEDVRMWTYNDLKKWVHLLKSKGNLHRGAKKEIRNKAEQEVDKELSVTDLLELFKEDALEQAMSNDINWLEDNMLSSKKTPIIKYLLKVIKRNNPMQLLNEPNVIVGTIHSVKGGEADVVYLFPDLSLAGMQEWQNDKAKDAIIRQFYVGMTRAKESLIICNPGGAYRVNL